MPLEITKETRSRAFAVCRDYLTGAWKNIDPDDMVIMHISGGLSNHIYYCSLPASTTLVSNEPSEVLLRFYGQTQGGGGALEENVIFTLLSERRLGPRLYGVFPEGRLEQYIPARSLTTEELANPLISRLIATRMGQIHALNVPLNKEPTWFWNCMKGWLDSSVEYLRTSLPAVDDTSSSKLSLMTTLRQFNLENEMLYVRCLVTRLGSPVVFAHNDMQEGNILFNKACTSGRNRISFIDFEFSSYNYRGFDLTNHFCEWMYSYKLQVKPYFTYDKEAFPNRQQQLNFIRAYLFAYDAACGKMEEQQKLDKHSGQSSCCGGSKSASSHSDDEESDPDDPSVHTHPAEERLLHEVRVFTLASHLFWALWSIVNVQASNIPFGHLEYALVRMEHYNESKTLLENIETEKKIDKT